MADDADRLAGVLAAIDAANGEDPRHVTLAGEHGPLELVHARRATHWLGQLDPDPTAEQLVAIRAHHFRRWTRPRSNYPAGRAGYLRWRAAAKRAHAAEVGELLARHGFDEAFRERVGRLIRKEGLADDPQVQAHEDALCLVFLEAQFDELADQLGDDHTVEVLAKTLAKMSPAGVAAAGTLGLSAAGAELLGRAAAR